MFGDFKMIPRFRPLLDMDSLREIFKIHSSHTLEILEQEFSKFFGVQYAHTFSYGRMALYSYLKVLNIKDKEIILPAQTCIVMIYAVLMTGNKVVFAETKENALNINLDSLKKTLSENTAMVILTSLFSEPIDSEIYQYLKKEHPDIKIVQDLTHLINGENSLGPVVHQCDAAILGLGLSKPITSLFGGILLLSDQELSKKIKKFKMEKIKKASIFRSIYMRMYLFLAYVAFRPFFYWVTFNLSKKNLLNKFTVLYSLKKVCLPSDAFEDISSFEASIGIVSLAAFKKNQKRLRKNRDLILGSLERLKKVKILNGKTEVVSSLCILQRDVAFASECERKKIEMKSIFDYHLPSVIPRENQNGEDYKNSKDIVDLLINFSLNLTENEIKYINMVLREIEK